VNGPHDARWVGRVSIGQQRAIAWNRPEAVAQTGQVWAPELRVGFTPI